MDAGLGLTAHADGLSAKVDIWLPSEQVVEVFDTNGKRIVLGLLALAIVAPIAGAATDTRGCYVRTYSALMIGDMYVYGVATEFWEESNGIDGLQRTASPCLEGDPLPADLCITHKENYALVSCASTYTTTTAV